MKTISRLIAAAFIMAMASGCGIFTSTQEIVSNINKGMSIRQIERMMGLPDYRRFESDKEEWEYHTANHETYYSVVIVKFTDGVVTGLDSYRVDKMPVHPPHHNDKPGVHINISSESK